MFTWSHASHFGGVNKETAAMLEGWEFFWGLNSNPSFCFIMQIWLLVTWAYTLHTQNMDKTSASITTQGEGCWIRISYTQYWKFLPFWRPPSLGQIYLAPLFLSMISIEIALQNFIWGSFWLCGRTGRGGLPLSWYSITKRKHRECVLLVF